MAQYPIEALMQTTMESLKEMIDVNTIVGDPVETPSGTIVIPISKVSFGFVSGGAEYEKTSKNKEENNREDQEEDNSQEEDKKDKLPFGGGSGAGVSVQPVAFMIVSNNEMKLMPVDQNASILDNVMNFMPKFLDKIQDMVKKDDKKEEENDIIL
ncbi:MAG: GerW family sporulation protein [Anaeromicrobium sp.]|jgi:sporulation protein YtfJ|uniref:GerW family sporulation protein n=1 Tax=Anaeromicrobium sp. TaxID=1929132 RepID=UPI0025EFE838|nr:GerW family sporulation protein [Anaeromicrobium sp.]MCT4594690.1 GerW family sporulation protein [Anaeromicrobium sp.]